MSFILDKNKEVNTIAEVGSLDNESTGDLILHFYSTFDNYNEAIVVTNVEQKGKWLVLQIQDNIIPDRSGRYLVEFFTVEGSQVSLDQLFQSINSLMSPWDNLDGYTKDVKIATTVGEVINATNALFKANNRDVVYKEYTRLSEFDEYERTTIFKTNY